MLIKNDVNYLLQLLFILQIIQYATFQISVSTEEAPYFYRNLPAQVVWAVLGKDVDLPCDITPPTPNDNVTMVLWFKGTTGMPLYSLDCRNIPEKNCTHWATAHNLGRRSFFVVTSESTKAHLHIRNVTQTDEGLFRCRIDYFSSPTRNFRLNLTLVVPSSNPQIFDGQGHEVVDIAGPFLEGYDLFLSCQVKGGKPPPTVKWFERENILDGVVDTTDDSYTTVNQLTIHQVSRSMNNTRLICVAQTHYQSPPLTRAILISVYLKPNYVRLIMPTKLLSVLKVHLIKCETTGSYPTAEISWYLDGERLITTPFVTNQVNNLTISILNLKVSMTDDNKELVCRAANPHISDKFIESREILHIAYPPAVYIMAGPGIDSSNLHEGTEVNLSCEAHANPSPFKYNWYHGENLLKYNADNGIIPFKQNLTLKKINRNSNGEYRCEAINSEGETRSVPFKIKVLYRPRCRQGFEVKHIGAFRNNVVIAHCEVDAAPNIIKFYWTYNNSQGDFLPVQGQRTISSGFVSQLYFNPKNDDDFGTLACWATNSVGNQKTPCYFHIKPARPPSPPENCQIQYLEDVSVEVACTPGEDGGITQRFSLEVLEDTQRLDTFAHERAVNDQATNVVTNQPRLFRILENVPVFQLHNLEHGHEYRFIIRALNSKGESDPPVIFERVKVRSDQHRTDNSHLYKLPPESLHNDPSKLYLMIAIASLTAVFLLSSIISITVCICKRVRANDSSGGSGMSVDKEMELAGVRRRQQRESSDDGGFGDSFRRHSEMFTRSASIEQSVPISRRISQHLVIDHPDLIRH